MKNRLYLTQTRPRRRPSDSTWQTSVTSTKYKQLPIIIALNNVTLIDDGEPYSAIRIEETHELAPVILLGWRVDLEAIPVSVNDRYL